MNKELIKQRFGRKLNSYNKNARIQKQMAEKLVNMIIPASTKKDGTSILEIGCGTGLLTALTMEKISFKSYTALDIVPECENYIKKINSKIDFIHCDIEDFIKISKNKYDFIVSNAALQWVENLPDVIDKLIEMLNPNGCLLFSTFGKENFREIYYVLGKSLTYYSKQELEKYLSKYNPNIEEEVRIMAFKTPQEVLKHIQNTGVNALSHNAWTRKDLVHFENEYNVFCAGHPTLTYNPIYVLITK